MSQKLTNRQKELKGIYKQYCDLPLNIVKQIIDYKSNKPHSLSKYIEDIKYLNERISTYERAIQSSDAWQRVMGNEVFPIGRVLIDYGNGYGRCMNRLECVAEINDLKKQKDKAVALCRYAYQMKRSIYGRKIENI